jgi:glycosyl transferase family 25
MKAYVINLDTAPERWEHMKQAFAGTPFSLERVSAVSGKELRLPMPEFDEDKFRRRHGRLTNIFEVACYLSHIKAMRAFLDSGESHAIICEDDLYPKKEAPEVIARLMKTAGFWNMARLAGLKLGKPLNVSSLGNGYSLTVPMHRFKGTGAYIVDRKAAQALCEGLLPMWLPYDHALDREWAYNFKVVSVAPFPISQTEEEFVSAIQGNAQRRLPSALRWRWTYPYQIQNELTRWIVRGVSAIGLKWKLPRS